MLKFNAKQLKPIMKGLDLNTSYVKVQLSKIFIISPHFRNLNTSYVKVQPNSSNIILFSSII